MREARLDRQLGMAPAVPTLAEIELPPQEVAVAAGLVHVDHEVPGIDRRRCGRGFSYRDPSGRVLDGELRSRVEALAVPPAWTEVWICPDEDGHLQAVGRDDAGRLQYLYHPDFRAEAERVKYQRLGPFGSVLEDLRVRVEHDMDADDDRLRKIASAVRLIDRGLLRVGGDEPAGADDVAGATTLRVECVTVEGAATIGIEYVGKGDIAHCLELEDELLAAVLRDGIDRGGEWVFEYDGADGARHVVSAAQVNDYLREVTGQAFTAKDFRTWGGTVVVAEHLAVAVRSLDEAPDDRTHERLELDAVDAAAERLGNTRAVARASYLSPVVVEASRDGRLVETWERTRTGARASRAERTVMRLHA